MQTVQIQPEQPEWLIRAFIALLELLDTLKHVNIHVSKKLDQNLQLQWLIWVLLFEYALIFILIKGK